MTLDPLVPQPFGEYKVTFGEHELRVSLTINPWTTTASGLFFDANARIIAEYRWDYQGYCATEIVMLVARAILEAVPVFDLDEIYEEVSDQLGRCTCDDEEESEGEIAA